MRHGYRDGPIRILAILLVSLGAVVSWASPQNAETVGGPSQPPGTLSLHLSLGGRTSFHIGEIVPVEMTFSSSEHNKYWIMSRECLVRDTYRYHVEPPAFLDRITDLDAGLRLTDLNCEASSREIDLGEMPFKVKQLLNDRFRMETPGRYRVSVTSHRVSAPVTSNTVELEILPADSSWEQAELARAMKLLELPRRKPERAEGCLIARFLGTDAANLEMAKRYTGDAPASGECDSIFEPGIISAANRRPVLEALENGLTQPDHFVGTGSLRTTAVVSVYELHPDWYPPPLTAADPQDLTSERSGLWRHEGGVLLKAEELRYARKLADALPQKTSEAAGSALEALLYMGQAYGVETPEEIRSLVRARMPGVFRSLDTGTESYLLHTKWPDLKSQALAPVLKDIVEHPECCPGVPDIALRRLYDLSPEETRAYILGQLRADYSRFSVDGLGLLPEEQLPELDRVFLERLKRAMQVQSPRLDDAPGLALIGLVERYASPAIAGSVRLLVEDKMESADCRAVTFLLAYFLRTIPQEGAEMLRKAMEANGPTNCRSDLLRRLAELRMLPAIEDAAVSALDHADADVVRDALYVLQRYGSAGSRNAVLQHFRLWHAAWAPRAKELEGAAYGKQVVLEGAYLRAAGTAQGWLASKEELQALRELCVTNVCRQQVDGTINWRSGSWNGGGTMIQMASPTGDEIAERFSIDDYPVGSMDRLKQKMAQYPKGTRFRLDAGWFVEPSRVQRIYEQIQPWAAERGFDLRVNRE